jgi:hypothetical protein
MGDLPQYYVHECHPAIIDRETFQKVQEEITRRASLRKTAARTKTELGKYSGKYALTELLVCGECGSPYRRVIWTQKEEKRVVWRCGNRLDHGKRICKKSPTLDEYKLHGAIVGAMNELFNMQAARQTLQDCVTVALAGGEQRMSLPAVESQIRRLQERQMELYQLAVGAGAECLDFDEEINQVTIAKTQLLAKKAELEWEEQTATEFDQRVEEITVALEEASGTINDFDELTVRQLVSNIKVLDKERLLIRFKDGTEIEQSMEG